MAKYLQVMGSFGGDNASGTAEIPVFDLEALGLNAIPITGGTAELETDTAEIIKALTSGLIRFGIPFSLGEIQATVFVTCTSAVVSDMAYMCNATFVIEAPIHVTIEVYPDGIFVAVTSTIDIIDSYMEEALGGDF